MIYRFINSLPRGWRYRSQRLWLHTRDIRDLVWQQSPRRLLEGAFVVPFTGFILLAFIRLLAQIIEFLWAAFLLYGLSLLLLSGCKAIALRVGR